MLTALARRSSASPVSYTHLDVYKRQGYTFKTPGPASCCIFTVKDSDKPEFVDIAWKLKSMGYKLYGTSGTCAWLNKHMVPCNEVRNMSGEAPINYYNISCKCGNMALFDKALSEKASFLDEYFEDFSKSVSYTHL